MGKYQSCSFTGHRPHKFPWRYNETDSRCTALKTALAEQITSLAEAGVTAYYGGGADGGGPPQSTTESGGEELRQRCGMRGSWGAGS